MQEFTPLDGDAGASSPQRLTLAGLEVESIEPVAPPFSGVVVGEVLECARHPEADKLSVCEVTTDGDAIGCRSSAARRTCARGLKVAVATVGARAAGRRQHQAREAARARVERHAVLGARARARARSTTASWSCPSRSRSDRDLRDGAGSRRHRARGECHAEPRRLHERVRHRARLRGGAGTALPHRTAPRRSPPRTTRVFPVRIEGRRAVRCSPRA